MYFKKLNTNNYTQSANTLTLALLTNNENYKYLIWERTFTSIFYFFIRTAYFVLSFTLHNSCIVKLRCKIVGLMTSLLQLSTSSIKLLTSITNRTTSWNQVLTSFTHKSTSITYGTTSGTNKSTSIIHRTTSWNQVLTSIIDRTTSITKRTTRMKNQFVKIFNQILQKLILKEANKG